jgi:hypothetical protein
MPVAEYPSGSKIKIAIGEQVYPRVSKLPDQYHPFESQIEVTQKHVRSGSLADGPKAARSLTVS